MPDSEGSALPSEQHHFNLDGLEGRNRLADEVLDIGLRGLNKTTRMPYALEAHVFSVANKNYEQAVEAFRYGLNEPSMVMVRATIDAMLFAAGYTVIDNIRGFEVRMGGTMGSHIKQVERIKWRDLSKTAKELGINLKRRRQLYRIRDRYGNFAAHNAARQMSDLIKYSKLSEEERRRVKPPKWSIKERDAYYVLKQTGRSLAYVRRTYALRTLKSLGWAESSTHTSHL